MRFTDLDKIWQRIFTLEWESVCEKSKAIAAVIADENGNIISEGRNRIGENNIPNPRVSHAEVEAIRSLDLKKFPNVRSYTLYAALEPCPMCLGTLVMGGIRHVVIGARDEYGGAMNLLELSPFMKRKNVSVYYMPQHCGDIQRGLQSIKELLYNDDKERLERMLTDFAVLNPNGVAAAKQMVSGGWFSEKMPKDYSIAEIFDRLSELIEK